MDTGPTARPHPLRRAAGALLTAGVLAAVAVALAVAVVPAVAGATAYTILSSSMAPALPVGSVVVVRPRPAADVAPGDVITFLARDASSPDTRVVTHRVVAVEPGPAFRTRGDANADPDPGLVVPADVRGVRWYSVPWVGLAVERLTTPPGLVAVAGGLLLVLGAHLLLPRHAAPGRAAHRARR